MNINQVVESARDLPPTPQILPKLRVALRNTETGVQEIEDIIRVDAPLTARVIRLSNSGWLGCSVRCESIRDAIGRLGFAEVYRTVAAAATSSVLGGELPVYRLDSGELWEISVSRAVYLKNLTKLVHGDLDSGFTIGLLSEIGKVVINGFYLQRGLEIYAEGTDDVVSPDTERKILGFDHCQVGSQVLQKWGFSDEVTQPVAHYYEPEKAGTFVAEAALLRIAGECVRCQAIGELQKRVPESLWEAASLDVSLVPEALGHALEELDEMRESLMSAA